MLQPKHHDHPTAITNHTQRLGTALKVYMNRAKGNLIIVKHNEKRDTGPITCCAAYKLGGAVTSTHQVVKLVEQIERGKRLVEVVIISSTTGVLIYCSTVFITHMVVSF